VPTPPQPPSSRMFASPSPQGPHSRTPMSNSQQTAGRNSTEQSPSQVEPTPIGVRVTGQSWRASRTSKPGPVKTTLM
jgi:hypothetical protein